MAQLVVRAEQLQPGESLEFQVFGSPAILVNDDGVFRAYLNICPHRGGPMMFDRENNLLRCQWHDSTWSLVGGDRLGGPAEEGTCLTPIHVEVRNGYVYAEG